MIRAGLTKLLAAWAITSASAAQAQGPDIDGWLARPGVRLLAIDFLPIAGACDECRAAVPRYRALRQRYAAAGLEVLLVVPETDDGCTPPDWPSELVYCDVGGTFARRLKVFEPMQALLMDWQGQRLVDHGTFDEVDKAAQAWLRAHPSVQLDVRTPPAGVSADDL